MRSDAASVAAFVACLYAGVPCAPIPPLARRSAAGRVEAIARSAGAGALIAPPGGDDETLAVRLQRIDPEAGLGQQGVDPSAIRENDIAIIQYTSGSTSDPKGVALTHGNVTANLEMLRVAFSVTGDSRFMSWLPLFHDMGLAMVLMPLYFGVPGTLMPPTSFVQQPMRWLKAIAHHRATITGAPNFAFEACLRRASDEDVAELDLSGCELAFCGAEPVRLSTMRGFASRFAASGFRASALYPCYGMAEAMTFVSGGRLYPDDGPPTLAEGTGALAPCGESGVGSTVAIVDPESLAPCADGVVGEVWIAGPHVAPGYWNAQEATRAAFAAELADHPGESFMRSGDLGRMEAGVLTLTGRLKDVIIHRGVTLHAADIEATVAGCHPGFADIGAAFAWVEDGEERLVVVQEATRRARGLDSAAMTEAALEAVARSHGVRLFDLAIVRAGKIPRTTSGKVRRSEARRIYATDGFERVAKAEHPSLERFLRPTS